MVVGSIYLSNEMLAAGVETMHKAKVECLEDAAMVIEIYLAMVEAALYEQATVQ